MLTAISNRYFPIDSMQNIVPFCRRIGLSLNSGLSLVEILKREATRQKPADAQMWLAVAQNIENGDSFADAVKPFRKQLGDMFVALSEVGEQTGLLGEMLLRIADYAEKMQQIRTEFRIRFPKRYSHVFS